MRTVVGAAILNDRAQVFAARRSKTHAGLWEFPGGKVEPGESPQDALVREIQEELSASIDVVSEITAPGSPWRINGDLELRIYLARLVGPPPVLGSDHDASGWFRADELPSVPWLPSDFLALSAVARAIEQDG